MLEAALVDLGLGPDEGLGVAIIGFDEGIDVLPELLDRGEGRAAERLTFEDREPDLDLLSHEARVGVKWKRTLGWRLSQRSVLGLWVLRLSSTT